MHNIVEEKPDGGKKTLSAVAIADDELGVKNKLKNAGEIRRKKEGKNG